METRFRIGEIANTHGIKGEVKVYPTTDDRNRFKKLKKCTLDTGKEQIELNVAGCKFVKNMVVLKFKEYDDINQIERYKHCGLYVDREDAVKLEKDEYYIADLIGMQVLNEDDTELGNLKDVIQTGANDVYIVTLSDPKTEQKEVLIPAIKQCILDMDVENAVMKVHLLEGLIE